jgi:FlaA1/EpsC-like NDP-sugar epimerase
MRSEDAVNLLLRSSNVMHGGEVFVFKMDAVKIPDLFSTVVRHLSGDSNLENEEVDFELIGTKPGEKLHEDLYTEEESKRTLELPDMFVIIPNIPDLEESLVAYYTTLGAKRVSVGPYNSKMGNMLDAKGIKKLISGIEV